MVFVVLACFSVASHSGGAEPKEPGQFKSLAELRNYVEQKIGKEKLQRQVSPELLMLTERVIEPSASVSECEQLVIRYIREQYARDAHPDENREIRNADGQVIDGLAFLLFMYKGSLAGAFEYTRLCHGSIVLFSQYAHLFPQDQRERIVPYRLFVLVSDLNFANTDEYVWQRGRASVSLEGLVALTKEYPQNAMLQRFLLGYPFESNSYLTILDRLASQKMSQRSREEIFFEYLTKIFTTTEERLGFLRTVALRDSTLLSGLLTCVAQQDTMFKEDASYAKGILDLAIQTRNWPVVVQTLSNPLIEDQTARLSKQVEDAIKRTREEEALLSALSKEIQERSSQPEKPSDATAR